MVLSSLLCVPAWAANNSPSLEQLLSRVRHARQANSRIDQARVQRFLRQKNHQAALLRRARAHLHSVQARTDRLRKQYRKNRQILANRKKKLDAQAGNIKQILAVVRQITGDLTAVTRDSLVSAQFPGRLAKIKHLAQSKKLPSLDQLHSLWFLLQQQMTASGEVVNFKAPVVGRQGERHSARVTRVGAFVAVAGGQYLSYDPGVGLQVLPSQPSGHAQALARRLPEAGKSPVPMVIDPTRGSVLALLGRKPTLTQRLRQGGVVGYLILALGLLGLLIALARLIYLAVVSRRVKSQMARLDGPRDDNPLGRILAVLDREHAQDMETLELKLDEAILKETPRLERGQPLIKLLAAVAPLLGLLGTVVGMIATFQAITLFGTGDPKLMAGGISQALVTTVLGLIVAIPLLFIHSVVASRSRALIQVLDEQSAGSVARRLEGSHG